jgi:hypothetical protein
MFKVEGQAKQDTGVKVSLFLAFNLASCSVYSTLKMEAICAYEASIDFQRTTWRYVPEDITLHEGKRPLRRTRHGQCRNGALCLLVRMSSWRGA